MIIAAEGLLSWRLGKVNGAGSFCGAPRGLFLAVFPRPAVRPLEDSVTFFPFF